MDERSFFSQNGLYARIMNGLWNYIVLSVLWVVCCIPLVTASAATAAAYYTAAKVIRAGEGKVAQEFFHAFKTNFRPSLPLAIGYTLAIAWLAVDAIYVYSDTDLPLPVLYLFYGLILFALASGFYLSVFLSRFTESRLTFLRMAVFGVFRHLIPTILLLALLAAAVVGVYLMPWGILIFPGVLFWLLTFLMEPVLKRYMPPREVADPDEQKWYYDI